MSGSHIDDLAALSEPTVNTDRYFVGRSGELYRQDASAVRGNFLRRSNMTLVKPTMSDLGTWLNQNSATITEVGDALSLAHPSNVAQVIARTRNLPSGNFEVQLGLRKHWITKNFLVGGLVLRESVTGKLETFGFGHRSSGGLLSSKWNSVNSYNADRAATGTFFDNLWVKARRYGTDLTWWFSPDGAVWAQFGGDFAQTNFFTTAPDQWGMFIQPSNETTPNNAQRLDAFHWSEGTEVDNTPGVPAYFNPDGKLDRTLWITVTTTAMVAGGTINNLVDGGFNNDNADGVSMTNGETNKSVTFQFPNAKIITAAKWFQNASQSNGTWKWQGSNDGSIYADLSSTFTLDDATAGAGGSEIGDLSANTTAYLYYRMLQTAGTISSAQRWKEIEFKIMRG
jgi:hypothetical protein